MSIIYPGVEELVPVQVKKEENEEKHADTGVNEASAGVNRKLAIELEVVLTAPILNDLTSTATPKLLVLLLTQKK